MTQNPLISSSESAADVPRLSVHHATKIFPGVVALDDVCFDVLSGEIHAMAGENGAGKSTLMHIIAGVHQPNSGQLYIDGLPYAPTDEKAAQQAGVAIVFQEGSLFPPLSVAENIFVGRQPLKGITVDFAKMRHDTRILLDDLDMDIDPLTKVSYLSPGQRQLVEIAKALSQKVRLLILDEPTSSLSMGEARKLFSVLRQLASRGVGIVYVTHRLGEIFELADRVTVLKDGRVTGVRDIKNTTPDEIIGMEVGRELSFAPDVERAPEDARVVLEIDNLSADPVKNASLKVRAGEIVCLAGLVGCGRTELCEAIFGVRTISTGQIRLNGREIAPSHPVEAMQAGIGMVPEDRRTDGLFLAMSITKNVSAGNMEKVSRSGVMKTSLEKELAGTYLDMLRIAAPDVEREVMYLSGGNQQKVLLARWLARRPDLLIVDEPTRGVDVGAKSDLYNILRDLAKNGMALLVVSSDLPEVLALAHRIVVMSEGVTVGEMDAREADEVTILQMATPQSAVKQGA